MAHISTPSFYHRPHTQSISTEQFVQKSAFPTMDKTLSPKTFQDLPPLYVDQLDPEERKVARIREDRIEADGYVGGLTNLWNYNTAGYACSFIWR